MEKALPSVPSPSLVLGPLPSTRSWLSTNFGTRAGGCRVRVQLPAVGSRCWDGSCHWELLIYCLTFGKWMTPAVLQDTGQALPCSALQHLHPAAPPLCCSPGSPTWAAPRCHRGRSVAGDTLGMSSGQG